MYAPYSWRTRRNRTCASCFADARRRSWRVIYHLPSSHSGVVRRQSVFASSDAKENAHSARRVLRHTFRCRSRTFTVSRFAFHPHTTGRDAHRTSADMSRVGDPAPPAPTRERARHSRPAERIEVPRSPAMAARAHGPRSLIDHSDDPFDFSKYLPTH
ncbi:hypothetical protein EVAR_91481_1 [Eumeta japonica]|uniref:Uncharacterized protein n=1 Tax=Eumeta variegata TaxID=151549 RepID=A0A4C1VBN0_EUMVA|nr:hypothetical protein EVAR_91481_1 [Eumeta japonica]